MLACINVSMHIHVVHRHTHTYTQTHSPNLFPASLSLSLSLSLSHTHTHTHTHTHPLTYTLIFSPWPRSWHWECEYPQTPTGLQCFLSAWRIPAHMQDEHLLYRTSCSHTQYLTLIHAFNITFVSVYVCPELCVMARWSDYHSTA